MFGTIFLTFISAGHETTALALTWTFYLLSLHPEAEWRAKQEVAALTRGGPLLPEHVDALAYTSQVIQEAMRLYPPAAAIVRAARRDVQIGNEHVSAGTTVYVPRLRHSPPRGPLAGAQPVRAGSFRA